MLTVSGARDATSMLMFADSALRTEERAWANTLGHYVIAEHRIIGEKEKTEKLRV